VAPLTKILADRCRSAARLYRHLRREGFRNTAQLAALRLLFDHRELEPLWRARTLPLFETDADKVREWEKGLRNTATLMFDASTVEKSYPEVFEDGDQILRYAWLPATGTSRGLVVLFHSFDAWLKTGPLRNWREFDVLAPWDTFGWKRRGSWFWGEKGDNFVEGLIQKLIAKYHGVGTPLFYMGGSMGGFGALYHGLKFGSNGIYAICPQVDLRAKIREKGEDDRDNPFGYLAGETLESVPDLLSLAEESSRLPPLFLIQSQKDPINPFATHGYRLLDVYNRRDAWYGVRVYPTIGHGADGTQEEAAYFFSLILDKLSEAGG
jgi:hypothetical protein